jgi:hypothetical protein
MCHVTAAHKSILLPHQNTDFLLVGILKATLGKYFAKIPVKEPEAMSHIYQIDTVFTVPSQLESKHWSRNVRRIRFQDAFKKGIFLHLNLFRITYTINIHRDTCLS